MKTVARHEPTRDQLLAMAYVDGELSGRRRREFEDVLCRDPALRGEVSEWKALDLFFRRLCCVLKPEGLDWRRRSERTWPELWRRQSWRRR